MIEINLLSEEFKQSRLQRLRDKKYSVTLILLSVNALLFAALLIVSAISIARFATLRALDTRLRGLAPEQQKIMAMIASIKDLKSRNEFYNKLAPEGFRWSAAFNTLSDLLVPGIWFRQMLLAEPRVATAAAAGGDAAAQTAALRTLKINGTAVSVVGDEMAVINEFIKSFKDDTVFAENFKNIALESVMRRQIAGVDVMDFTLLCSFKENVI